MSQYISILRHLTDGGTITALAALNRYGCFRLAAVIFNLRRDGHDIRTTMITENGKTFARYHLVRRERTTS